MQNIRTKTFLILLPLLIGSQIAFSQQKPKEWTLRSCIDYAIQNNIQIRKQRQTIEIGKIDLSQSQASRLPSLNGSAGQSFTNQKSTQGGSGQEQSFTGNY